ncbi:GNAT family N-acetyltransferase [Pseudoalteromonas aurantia]|uniref:GNAT family N-acetyltransferase n=2 Tax=Pseudoalteromonas TaxID=53246 RepID=A0ABY2VXK9_9GAMM|nr:GNAT family N-acetyltransferase [Pseudoalteromonas aurantia]TMO63260.1 GNAT family N-acetyltransferase [Pseudoalteromonas aurantia]TMO74422.1 GNAT family N-acetyltransferase [Pseudoalteromonas aurantia]
MSKLNNYKVVATQIDGDWDILVESSSSATPFALSSFVNALHGNFRAFLCKKGDEIVAGCLVVLDDTEHNVVGHDLVVHDGIFFREFEKLNRAQKNSEQFKALQCIAEFLAEEYSHIDLTLAPMLTDVRAFQWVHYHDNKPMYQESIRYTSFVDIREFLDKKPLEDFTLYQDASVSRRQEIRYGYRKGVKVFDSNDFERFLFLYKHTFERQNIELENDLLTQMSKLLVSLYNDNRILMISAATTNDEVGSMAVFLMMADKAYYLFGANDYALRNAHTGTAVLWQAFPFLAKKGIVSLDLEGVNSPDRGWFKMSFGATIQPYINLTYRADKD